MDDFRFILLNRVLIICLIAGIMSFVGHSQSSVTGAIAKYNFNCPDGTSCSVDGESSVRYYYTAPFDGELVISGFAKPGVISCCGTTYQMSCNGSFRKLKAFDNIHNFGAQTTTGGLTCIAAGDTIEINFNGTFGDYGYTAAVIPDVLPSDPEPNDQFSSAVELIAGNSYAGHLRYGIYQYDNWDNYMYVAEELGSLSLSMTHSDGIKLSRFRNDQLFLGSEQQNSPSNFIIDCLTPGDTVLIQLSSQNDCMSYNITADFVPPIFGTDHEPNDTKSLAITATTDIFGTIGHGINTPVSPDANDYYQLPFIQQGDELSFRIVVQGGPVLFRLRSERFAGFSLTLGSITDGVIEQSFQPTFDDTFYLQATTSTGHCGYYQVNLGGCVKELSLVGTETRSMDIRSDSIINSSQTLMSLATVSYQAAHTITLEPDFQVEIGAVFHALIAGCHF